MADIRRLDEVTVERIAAGEVVVRAVERNGTVQTREETGPAPDGPAGWVSDTVDPDAL